MLSGPKDIGDLDRMVDEIRNADVLTPALVRQIVANACTRLPILKNAGKAAHIDLLIEAGAWCDAALALIDVELPAWSIRRIDLRGRRMVLLAHNAT